MDFQKDDSLTKISVISPPSEINNAIGLLIAVCLASCTPMSSSSTPPTPIFQESTIPDTHNLDKLAEFISAHQERPDDEFSADDGRVLTRKEILESSN